jgi:hypothetical protein
MKLVADDSRLQIDRLEGTLTALQVDNLISQLAELRAAMTPPVSQKRPDPLKEPELRITMEDEPEMTAAFLRDGRFRLWVRNRGFGWCAYNITAQHAAGLGQYMLGKLPPGEAVDLFADQGGKPH